MTLDKKIAFFFTFIQEHRTPYRLIPLSLNMLIIPIVCGSKSKRKQFVLERKRIKSPLSGATLSYARTGSGVVRNASVAEI